MEIKWTLNSEAWLYLIKFNEIVKVIKYDISFNFCFQYNMQMHLNRHGLQNLQHELCISIINTQLNGGKMASTYIINTRNLGRCKFCMVRSTTGRVYPSTSDPLLQYGIINCKVEHLINFNPLLLKHLIKLYMM